MPRENLELAREICEAWERGDYRSADWAHPEIEFVVADGPAAGEWSGREGMAEAWRTWLEAWEEFHQEAGDYRELDGGRVLVSFTGTGRGKTSGLSFAEISPRVAAGLFEIADGKVTRFSVYLDRENAVADLGL